MNNYLQQIDFNNYQTLELLNSGDYSITFFKYFKGMRNADYLKGVGTNHKNYITKTATHTVNIIKSEIKHKQVKEHPFSNIQNLMLSYNELQSGWQTGNYIYEINSINNIIKEDLGYENMSISKSEKFANPKSEFLKLLVQNYGEHNKNLITLKNNLQYVEVYDNSYIQNSKESIYADFYQSPLEKSYESIFKNRISIEFNRSKELFGQELNRIAHTYDYFDDVFSKLLSDFKHLQKILNREEGYFVPIIKEFKHQFLGLLRWLYKEYDYLLTKENKKTLELELSPREYITTYKIQNEKRLHNHRFTNFASLLVSQGYIDNIDIEKFRQVLGNNRSVDGLINWKKSIGTLYTFISIMSASKNKVIISKNKWEIGSRYFMVEGKAISTSQLRDSKFSTNRKVVSELESIVQNLI